MEQKLGSCKKKKKKQAVTPYKDSVYNTPVFLLKPEKQEIHKKSQKQAEVCGFV